MSFDDNEFFREMTIRLCGSLEIDLALRQCLLFARTVIPLDEVQMSFFDPKARSLASICVAGIKDGKSVTVQQVDDTPLPPPLCRELEEVDKCPRNRKVNFPDPKDPFIDHIGLSQGWEESSLMVNRLIIDGKYIGSFVARVVGKNRYSGRHLRLWRLIYEPAAIAMVNTKRYREVISLNDSLADDKSYFQMESRNNRGEKLVGAKTGLKDVVEKVRMVASALSPVLLIGETGTGKEMVANAIHDLSNRKSGPFIKINCGAIPETLIDSELFGHEKGAFTGAIEKKRGRFERAHGGTIFLDEVSELPLQAQTRLLRVLQEKEFERVGGTTSVKVDARILSATNRSLEDLVSKGRFREDLYFRLSVFPISIPPLRERKGDIPSLIDHFIYKKSREMGLRPVVRLPLDRLMLYDWPGNVRELENVVERAIIISAGKKQIPHDFFDMLIPTKHLPAAVNDNTPTLHDVEVRHIMQILERTGGKVSGPGGAAELLSINPGTLRAKMKKLHIPFGRNTNTYRKGKRPV